MVSPSFDLSGNDAVSATQLRSLWRAASRDRGWSFPDDWWTPAVDAVAEAVLSGGDLVERCTRLGRARARAGVPMRETLADVGALAALVRSLQMHPTSSGRVGCTTRVDPLELATAAAVGWAEEPGYHGGHMTSESVAGLADCAYLSIRLGEVAIEAEAAGTSLAESHAFVVVSLLGPSCHGEELSGPEALVETWDCAWQMAQIADDLRSVFASGETIVQVGPTTAIVLARRTPKLAASVASLRALIEQRRLTSTGDRPPSVSIWVEGLPSSLRQARLLLADLRR